jgi:hypothetical protein
MDFGEKIDVRDRLGYSISEPSAKTSWIAMVVAIREYLSENDLAGEFLFHGTSSVRAEKILLEGLAPTDVEFAVWDQCAAKSGSFWGSIDAAACYAEDTAFERNPGSLPVILAVRSGDLASRFDVRCDGATLDFPMRGLTRLDDAAVEEKWQGNIANMTWETSLSELGAVVVIHDQPISDEGIELIATFEDAKEMFEKIRFRP